jgi:multidrug efflux pump subunit AcrB
MFVRVLCRHLVALSRIVACVVAVSVSLSLLLLLLFVCVLVVFWKRKDEDRGSFTHMSDRCPCLSINHKNGQQNVKRDPKQPKRSKKGIQKQYETRMPFVLVVCFGSFPSSMPRCSLRLSLLSSSVVCPTVLAVCSRIFLEGTQARVRNHNKPINKPQSAWKTNKPQIVLQKRARRNQQTAKSTRAKKKVRVLQEFVPDARKIPKPQHNANVRNNNNTRKHPLRCMGDIFPKKIESQLCQASAKGEARGSVNDDDEMTLVGACAVQLCPTTFCEAVLIHNNTA